MPAYLYIYIPIYTFVTKIVERKRKNVKLITCRIKNNNKSNETQDDEMLYWKFLVPYTIKKQRNQKYNYIQ